MREYGKYVDEKLAFKELVKTLKSGLGRELTYLEIRKVKWLANCEYETVGVLLDLFKELADKEK